MNTLDKPIKVYSKMEQNKQLTNKKGVFVNMRDYYINIGKDPFEVLPFTYLVKNGLGDNEFKKFCNYFNELEE